MATDMTDRTGFKKKEKNVDRWIEAAQDCFIAPMPGKVVVLEDNFKYKGTLVIPDTAKRRPTTGHVMRIGEGVTKVSLGDRVVYPLWSGTLIEFQQKAAYRILAESEILAGVEIEDAELSEVTA